ncbi:MAG: hypothetical protein NTW65_05450 [Deltaproteobacteria bacterium]|nr:hypothetical protein [Deltaproteobacteria bacterium]
MNIVIVGAGNIGSIFAARLIAAEHQVKVIARNRRLQDIQQKGIRLKPQFGTNIEHYAVTALPELTPDVPADLILVTVQRHQIDALMPALTAHPCPCIAFMFNCGEDDSLWQKQLKGRLVWAFPSALGNMQDGIVEYVVLPGFLRFLQITTVGINAGGSLETAKKINKLFNEVRISSVLHYDMRSWLASHLALMLPPMALGVRKLQQGKPIEVSFAESRLIARAQQEAFRVIRSLKLSVTPMNMWMLSMLPSALVAPFLWMGFQTKVLRKALKGHADHAHGEVVGMYNDLKKMANKVGFSTPAIDTLCEKL